VEEAGALAESAPEAALTKEAQFQELAGQTGEGNEMLYRAMTAGGDDMPMTGSSARTLGVRTPPDPYPDIRPDANGLVHPGTGGMSTAPSPDALDPWRRPPGFGVDGTGKDPLWRINVNDLGSDLNPVLDHPGHICVEPAQTMPYTQYQNALWATRPFWQSVLP
jgi:hypothetical protein